MFDCDFLFGRVFVLLRALPLACVWDACARCVFVRLVLGFSVRLLCDETCDGDNVDVDVFEMLDVNSSSFD